MDLPKTTTGSEKKARLTMAEKLQQFEANLSRGMSQRRAANDVGIARGTLLDWKDRVEAIPLSKPTVDFLKALMVLFLLTDWSMHFNLS